MSLEQYKDATRKELWEILQIQVERIAELDKDKTFLLTQRIMGNIIVSTSQELSKQVHIHNLEQQAKALSDARNDFTYSSDDICVDVDDLDKRIERLQGQAKALKEKGNE
jgi:aminoglycoside phosphotransferase